jgi:hypothetical protein
MNEMLEKYGVRNVRWTDDELAAFEAAWTEVLEEQSADPTFNRLADSYLAFRRVCRTWVTRRRSKRLTSASDRLDRPRT